MIQFVWFLVSIAGGPAFVFCVENGWYKWASMVAIATLANLAHFAVETHLHAAVDWKTVESLKEAMARVRKDLEAVND